MVMTKIYKWEDNYINSYQKGSDKDILYSINENGCWVCVSHSKNYAGYTDICRHGRRTKLHRYVYEKHYNYPLTKDEVVMHLCDNPSCMNPFHLEVGSINDNNQDKTSKGRQTKGSDVHTSKLTEIQVLEILKDTRSNRKIAEDYGVAHSTIGRIKKGVNWKCLTKNS